MLVPIFLCLLSVLVKNEAARILVVIPTPSISHQVVFRPLTQELARRGHEVVVVTTDPAFPKGRAPPNLTEIDVHDVSYNTIQDFIKTTDGDINSQEAHMKSLVEMFLIVMEKQIQTEEVQELLKDESRTFDLLLLEAIFPSALGFSHRYKVPVIQISSLGILWDGKDIIGAPNHPLFYPGFFQQKLYNLTMWDKVRQIYKHYSFDRMVASQIPLEEEVLRRSFGDDVPSLAELKNNVHMLFLNIHPIFEGNHPVPPSVVYMGGIHQQPQKDLPQDLKSYLDSSKHGVIYMSFGTNTMPSLLPAEKIQMFVRIFSRLPYDVLWKWDKDELPGRTENIKIAKWFPQSDLLRHPKVKLFITQGGLQSTDEAITAGVPLLGVPMLGDQWYNVEKYVHHKIGLRLDLHDITEEKINTAINRIIHEESFRENIVRLRSLMQDQPESPLARAVWWTEHVLRHGGAAHLRAPAANISWARYYELELVAALLAAALLAAAAALVLLYTIYRLFMGMFTNVKVKKL